MGGFEIFFKKFFGCDLTAFYKGNKGTKRIRILETCSESDGSENRPLTPAPKGR